MRVFASLAVLISLAACNVQFSAKLPDRSASDQEKVQTRVAAENIVTSLDSGLTDSTWNNASSSLKTSLTKETWTAMQASRGTFGKVLSRGVDNQTFPRAVENAPPGTYAIVYFKTSFANYPQVQEEIVLRKGSNDWKLAGYWARVVKQK